MKKAIFLLALPVMILSCKKNDNPVPDGCPVQQSTVAGRYLITAIKYKASSSDTEQDMFAILDPCQKDDTLVLRRDSSVTVVEGPQICPGPPPPGGVTVWYMSADGKQFTFDDVYNVVSFDCTNLVVTKKDYFIAGDTRTLTFSKQ